MATMQSMMGQRVVMQPVSIDFESTWAQLESALLAVLADIGNGFDNELWMQLHTSVYYLCIKPTDPQNSRLFEALKDMLEQYCDGVLRDLAMYERQTTRSSVDLLVRYRDAFNNYRVGMEYSSKLFAYLDRHWINTNHSETGRSPKEGVYFVYELSLRIWKERVFEALKVRLRCCIMQVLNAAREQNALNLADDGTVKSVLETYEVLGFEKGERSELFQQELENYLVSETTLYFGRRGSTLLQYLEVPQYLEEVERYLSEEVSRCESFVGPYSQSRLLAAAQEALIAAHSPRLVAEARNMLIAQPEKRTDLRRLYTLISYLMDADEEEMLTGPGGTPLVPGGPHGNNHPPNRNINVHAGGRGGAAAGGAGGSGSVGGSGAIGGGGAGSGSIGEKSGGGGASRGKGDAAMTALQDVVREYIREVGLKVVKDLHVDNDLAAAPAAVGAAAGGGVGGGNSPSVAVDDDDDDDNNRDQVKRYMNGQASATTFANNRRRKSGGNGIGGSKLATVGSSNSLLSDDTSIDDGDRKCSSSSNNSNSNNTENTKLPPSEMKAEVAGKNNSRDTSEDVVLAMMDVYEHYKCLVKESFKDSPSFLRVLDEASKSFVNSVPRAPEWLARYAHCLLDKSSKESRVDSTTRAVALDRVGFLFAYISDKDIYQRCYSNLLSKRIIQLSSVSDEAEERMLGNMRRISGFEFTSKMQRMFVDKSLSRELHAGYVEWQERRIMAAKAILQQQESQRNNLNSSTNRGGPGGGQHGFNNTGGGGHSVFTFTDDEEHASRMMEEMSVSGGVPGGEATMGFPIEAGGASAVGAAGAAGAAAMGASATEDGGLSGSGGIMGIGGGTGVFANSGRWVNTPGNAGQKEGGSGGIGGGMTAGASAAGGASSAGGSGNIAGSGGLSSTLGASMSILRGETPREAPALSSTSTMGGTSPPMSPMYFSPKGLSPRMNILPSFAWGKTMLKHLKRRHPYQQHHDRTTSSRVGSNTSARRGSGHGGGFDGPPSLEGRFFNGKWEGGTMILEAHNLFGLLSPAFEPFTFVLTAGCWPLQPASSTFKPPEPIQEYVQSFLEYYSEKHHGRKLEWLYHLGHGEMVVRGFNKPYRVFSSTFQMGILYQFNDRNSLTVGEIAAGVSVTVPEIVRHLHQLVKAGLLYVTDSSERRVTSCGALKPEHVVSLNIDFSSNRTCIKINIVDHSKQPIKEDKVATDVIADRKMSVQAAICRTMKARKKCGHTELLDEVKSQLEYLFAPNTIFIKKQVEELIDKDYLGRVEGEDAYMYLA